MKYRKVLRSEGAKLGSARLNLFPTFALQVPSTFWPRPEDVKVEPVLKVEKEAYDGGANVVCINFHREVFQCTAVDNYSKKSILRKKSDFRDPEIGHVPPAPDAGCILYGEERAVYLEIHSAHKQNMQRTMLLSMLRPGEKIELRSKKGGGFITKIRLSFQQVSPGSDRWMHLRE
eukprot:SAG31_NODE_5996_length_2222_cov_0.963731_3_plen_175_part_00